MESCEPTVTEEVKNNENDLATSESNNMAEHVGVNSDIGSETKDESTKTEDVKNYENNGDNSSIESEIKEHTKDVKNNANDLLKSKDLEEIVARSKLSVNAPEFHPREDNSKENSIFTKEYFDGLRLVIDHALSFCYTSINKNPADFSAVVDVVMPQFLRCIKHPDFIQTIAHQMLVDTLLDASYAYHAVKIYCTLIKYSKLLYPEDKTVRSVILDLTASFVDQVLNEQLAKPEYEEDVCMISIKPFFMFLGELYLQLEVPTGFRLMPICEAIIKICQTLLSSDHLQLEQRLLDICSVIKLTGKSMDEDNVKGMNELFDALRVKIDKEKENMSKKTNDLIHEIMNLRDSNWNTSTSVETPRNEDQATLDEAAGYNRGVLYGPDGRVIAPEEELFLNCDFDQWNLNQETQLSPSMDEEMVFAYFKFVMSLPSDEMALQKKSDEMAEEPQKNQ